VEPGSHASAQNQPVPLASFNASHVGAVGNWVQSTVDVQVCVHANALLPSEKERSSQTSPAAHVNGHGPASVDESPPSAGASAALAASAAAPASDAALVLAESSLSVSAPVSAPAPREPSALPSRLEPLASLRFSVPLAAAPPGRRRHRSGLPRRPTRPPSCLRRPHRRRRPLATREGGKTRRANLAR
jgi:hypothetical protein